MDDFIESLDPGLLTYKNELYIRSVTSENTLRYLRPREVEEMNIPDIYKRLLIDKICNLQTPETKKMMKRARSPVSNSLPQPQPVIEDSKRKRLFEDIDDHVNVNADEDNHQTGYLDNEIEKIESDQRSRGLEIMGKKEQLELKKLLPVNLKQLVIPGCGPMKTICDNCHHPGHKAAGNKGNRACPFPGCEGFHYCGLIGKHKEHKAEIVEVSYFI